MAAMIHLHDASPFGHDAPPGYAKGLIPRDYKTHPVGFYASIPRDDVTPYTDDQIQAAIKRKDAEKSWLSDLRDVGNQGKPIPSRDQNGKGYCWAHSSVSACLLCRARDGQPYADLSAYAVACIIKGYRDEGGWGAESADFITKRGVPTSEFWPQQSMSSKNDTPATWANAALNKITFAFSDMQPNDDRALATKLINDEPVVVDYNWWSHSVCACRLVSWKPLSIWIWNSWGDSWSNNGMGVLSGSKASADGMVGVSLVRAAGA